MFLVRLVGEVNEKVAADIGFSLPLPAGITDPRNVDLRKVRVDKLPLASSPENIDVFRWTYGGATRCFRKGDEFPMAADEYAFVAGKFGNLVEILPSDVRTADEANRALVEHNHKLKQEAQQALGEAERTRNQLEEARAAEARKEARMLAIQAEIERLKLENEELKAKQAAKAKPKEV